MFDLDSHTLVIASALSSFVMCLTMYGMYLSNKSEKCLALWSYAGGFNVLGYIFATFTFEPTWVRLGISNSLFILAHLSIIKGLLQHLSIAQHEKSMALFISVFFATHFFEGINDNLNNRVILFTLFACFLKVISISLLTRAWKRSRQWTYLPLLFVELFFSLQLVLRSLAILLSDNLWLHVLTDHWIETLGWLSDLLYISVVTLSCALIIIRKQVLQIYKLSRTDSLSQCLNRHALKEIAPVKIKKSIESNLHLICLVMDIDHFKKVNDTFGHPAGDAVIQSVAGCAKSLIRESDDIFRVGGEEFLILLLADSVRVGKELAERIREKVEHEKIQFENKEIKVSISIGISSNQLDDTWDTFFSRADKALYRAKEEGRNRVIFDT